MTMFGFKVNVAKAYIKIVFVFPTSNKTGISRKFTVQADGA